MKFIFQYIVPCIEILVASCYFAIFFYAIWVELKKKYQPETTMIEPLCCAYIVGFIPAFMWMHGFKTLGYMSIGFAPMLVWLILLVIAMAGTLNTSIQ